MITYIHMYIQIYDSIRDCDNAQYFLHYKIIRINFTIVQIKVMQEAKCMWI